jgi:hypothetical protein
MDEKRKNQQAGDNATLTSQRTPGCARAKAL